MLRAFRSYQKRLAGARERSLSTGADLPDEPSVATRLREELTLLRSETAVIRHLPSLPAVDLTRAPTSPN